MRPVISVGMHMQPQCPVKIKIRSPHADGKCRAVALCTGAFISGVGSKSLIRHSSFHFTITSAGDPIMLPGAGGSDVILSEPHSFLSRTHSGSHTYLHACRSIVTS